MKQTRTGWSLGSASLLAIALLGGCSPAKPEKSLMSDARAGDLGAVEAHIHYKSDLDARDKAGFTPLQAAIVFDHPDVALKLIEAGAEVNTSDARGDTPLHVAATMEQLGTIQALVDKGANKNALNKEGLAPYQLALIYNRKPAAELLKKLGADTKIRKVEHRPRNAPKAG